jgi:hypothetical protein
MGLTPGESMAARTDASRQVSIPGLAQSPSSKNTPLRDRATVMGVPMVGATVLQQGRGSP